MKKCILALLLIASAYSVFSQTNMYWYNPFSFYPQAISITVSEEITQDTSGQLWFSAYDGLNSVFHVLNQAGTLDYQMSASEQPYGCFFDARNRMWVEEPWNWNLFFQLYEGGSPISLPVPHVWDYKANELDVIPDLEGNDYFLTTYPDANGVDSFFMTKYNGTTFQSTYLSSLGIPFSDTTVHVKYGWCYNNGALYIDCNSYGFMKYDQGNWTHITRPFDTLEMLWQVDAHNNFYFAGDTGSFLIKFNGSTYDTVYPPVGFNNVYNYGTSISAGPDGNLWLQTTAQGFYDYNAASNSWTNIATPGFVTQYNAMGWTYGWPAIFDRQGRMWTTGGSSAPPYIIGVYSFIPFNSISGRVFYDANGNGVPDNGEAGFTPINIVQSTNGYYANTDTAGNYAVTYIDSAIAHTVSATAPVYYHLTTPSSYTIGTTDTLGGYNFGVLANGNIQDLSITAASFWIGPGYSSLTWLNYQNTGTTTVSNTITYTFDSNLTYYQAWPSPAYVSGHTITWAYQSLQPFQTGTIAIGFNVSPGVTPGDTLTSTATIQPVASDTTPGNNVYENNQVVCSSFDPNFKTVSPSSGAAPGQELTYTVYFQNTGTAPAVNIVVYDTLDANLNPATFRLLGSSAPVKAALQGPGILSFTFNNIELPDSASSPALSEGFVQFAICIANPLTHTAATINNAAGIYFDFNLPVETNTATCNLGPTGILTVPANAGPALKLMPNPADNEVTIVTGDNATGGTLIVYDATGKRVNTQTISNVNTKLGLHQFAAGVYLLQVITVDGRSEWTKLVKE